ncbi:alpha-amylase family glycosyl hydrolase [Kineococcus glutinatus]|uniref:Glycosyl hydrolase family 13 catalytic domain-containing protein n=1 Tax=Kineococcus glutinatus TaxID=1070872 RepID=A0ABP9HZI6_9ACTN
MRHAPPRPSHRSRRTTTGLATAALALALVPAQPAAAADGPARVSLMGSLQSEIGCAADWDETCTSTDLTAVPGSPGRYEGVFTVPAGSYEYKVRLDGSWDESYGWGDANAPLVLQAPADLRFSYDHATHAVAVRPAAAQPGLTKADRALARSSLREDLTRERFYFVMADRFENGDRSNDTGGLPADRLVSGYDPTAKGFYHGGDLKGILKRLDYIEDLGTTALWLTPSFKNKPVQGTGDQVSAGYHGYWITDFTQIDPHLGTNDDLKKLVAEAHRRGIKVFFDIITNHTADVLSNTAGSQEYITKEAAPYRDASGTVFDDRDHAGTDTFPALDPRVSFPYTPTFPTPADATAKTPAWLNDPTLYHNRGNAKFDGGESDTYGDFVGLDDLFTEHPRVVDGMTDIYNAWVDFGIDGFRIDTVKHVNLEFWQEFMPAIQERAQANGNEKFFAFGEVYDANPVNTSKFTTAGRLQATLDFPFQARATGFGNGRPTTELQELFAADDQYTDADSNAYSLPTFLGNHDMGRIGKFLADGGATGEELLKRDQLVHALMYLTRGQPVVYYGDEQGFTGDGGDQDARQDMFPSKVATYNDDDLIGTDATTAQANFDTKNPLYRRIAELADLRHDHPTLADGTQIHRYASATDGVYAFSRISDRDDVEYVVAVNNSEEPRTVTFDTAQVRERNFKGVWPAKGTRGVRTDADGNITVTVPALSAAVWKATGSLARTKAAPVPAFSTEAVVTSTAGRAEIGVDVPGSGLNQVTFAYRQAGTTAWTTLGTDDNAPYRVFQDRTDLPAGTLLEYRAVLKDHSGNLAVAATSATLGADLPPGAGEDAVGDGNPVEQPASVNVAGDLNSEIGCAADWSPDCQQGRMVYDPVSQLWKLTVDLPAGSYAYKAAIDGTWLENYGAGAVRDGGNIPLTTTGGPVTFYYDHASHLVTSDAQGPIITAPGSFQSELGCAADWDPACTRPWLQDVNGDGTYAWVTTQIPAGSHEVKVAHGLGWEESYGAGGAAGGANIAFTVPADGATTRFTYDGTTHVLTVTSTQP